MSPTLTFAGGSTTNMDSEIVQVTVADNDIYERSEQVTVSIASVKPALVALIGEHHVHIFTLLDKNGICITVSGMSADKVWSNRCRGQI